MRIVQINTFPYKATGIIMLGMHRLLTEMGMTPMSLGQRERS